jgi:hypothetical protein
MKSPGKITNNFCNSSTINSLPLHLKIGISTIIDPSRIHSSQMLIINNKRVQVHHQINFSSTSGTEREGEKV